MAGIRGVDRECCLVVPVDVGKWSAIALVADHCHEVVVDPFTFELTDDGVRTGRAGRQIRLPGFAAHEERPGTLRPEQRSRCGSVR